jgi:acetyl-CoA C-acetyltransferase
MRLNNRTAVIGTSIMAPIAGQERSLEEILYDVTRAALKDAAFSISEIEGIVVASNDQIDGRAISVMAASGSVGGVDRDILSTPSAGEHAFVMGVLRVASGQYQTQLVVSWSATEATALNEVERLGADPYFHRRLPLDEMSSYALQATSLSRKVPHAPAAARALAQSRKSSAAVDPKRWPIEAGMVSRPVTGAVALVLASEDFVAARSQSNPAWVRGMGWATESGFLGDRDLSTAPALEEAARQAYAQAGISTPADMFDVAEISDPTPYQELMALEALGLSARGGWLDDISAGAFEPKGRLPINPSGGIRAVNPVYCAGLVRIAEAANQIRGQAGGHQIKGAKAALAHAASGFAMQYQTVVVLGGKQ